MSTVDDPLISLHMIKTSLNLDETRPNLIINGKLHIPRNQWETYIQDDIEKIRFTYIEGRLYDWRVSRGIYATFNDDHTHRLKDLAKVMKIRGYSKLNKAALFPIIWNNVVLEE